MFGDGYDFVMTFFDDADVLMEMLYESSIARLNEYELSNDSQNHNFDNYLLPRSNKIFLLRLSVNKICFLLLNFWISNKFIIVLTWAFLFRKTPIYIKCKFLSTLKLFFLSLTIFKTFIAFVDAIKKLPFILIANSYQMQFE